MLRGGSTPPAQQNVQANTPTPSAAQAPPATASMAPAGGIPGQPGSAQDLVAQGFYGYQGWGDAEALADFRATGGSGKGGPTSGGSGSGISGPPAAPSINLPELYEGLYASSGISDIEKQLSDQTKSFNEAVSKINDNPFLSEANRVGRIQKLQTDFNNATAGTRSDIATKKADIETRLQLETKQFDINSQQAQQAFNQFQTLLQSGGLDNATGEDIANMTRATGMSSSIINSAINANKQKNVQTQIISFDDGTNQGFAVINSQTGEIINKQTVTQSKPSASAGAKAPTIGSTQYTAESKSALNQFVGQRSNSYGHINPTDWNAALNAFLADSLGTRDDFIKSYARYTDPNRGDFQQAYGFSKDLRTKLTGE